MPEPHEETLPASHVIYAERLADEGVPIRAMARVFKQSTDTIREAVQTAILDGRIVQMPKDDWPVGQNRDDRTPTFLRQANRVGDEALICSCTRLFRSTKLQSALLAVLLNRNEVSKETMHQVIESRRPHGKDETNLKMVDVVICHLRKKLRPFNLKINTLWAYGYYIEPVQRKRIFDMVNEYVLGQVDKAALQDAERTIVREDAETREQELKSLG